MPEAYQRMETGPPQKLEKRVAWAHPMLFAAALISAVVGIGFFAAGVIYLFQVYTLPPDTPAAPEITNKVTSGWGFTIGGAFVLMVAGTLKSCCSKTETVLVSV